MSSFEYQKLKKILQRRGRPAEGAEKGVVGAEKGFNRRQNAFNRKGREGSAKDAKKINVENPG